MTGLTEAGPGAVTGRRQDAVVYRTCTSRAVFSGFTVSGEMWSLWSKKKGKDDENCAENIEISLLNLGSHHSFDAAQEHKIRTVCNIAGPIIGFLRR